MNLAKALAEFRDELESLNAAILRLERIRRAKSRGGRSAARKMGEGIRSEGGPEKALLCKAARISRLSIEDSAERLWSAGL